MLEERTVEWEAERALCDERSRSPGSERRIQLPCGFAIVLCWCPPGKFMMGSESGSDDATPVHRMQFERGFWMGKYRVPLGVYEAVTGCDPAASTGDPAVLYVERLAALIPPAARALADVPRRARRRFDVAG